MNQTLIAWLVAGAFFGVGALTIAVGIVGTPENTKLPSYRSMDRFQYPLSKLLLYPSLVAIVTFAATQWVVAAAGAFAATAIYPANRARSLEQARYVALTEAVAAWVEQLRDAILAGGGIETPLRKSAETGPELLRPDLRELAVAMDTHDTDAALQMFSHRVAHPLVDMLAVSYAIAARESTRGLPDLLSALSESARDEVATYVEVETSRKKVKSSARTILIVQAIIVVGAVVFGREFLVAYETAVGQMVLAFCVALVVGSQLWISHLSVVRRPPRFFGIDDNTATFEDVQVDQQGQIVLPSQR